VITQYKSHSLLRHLQRGWAFLKTEMNEFVDLLPAQQRVDEESWYRGTADAVSRTRTSSTATSADYVVVLAGDHIYKMNYALMLADHVAQGAPCTVAASRCRAAEASAFGVMAVDERRRITDFVEKPADPPPMPGKPELALASMGIYVFNAKYLYAQLERDMADAGSSHDFGKDIIPRVVREGNALAHPFDVELRGHQAGAGTLLARRGHDRRLLGRQHRPDGHRPAAEHVRHALADLDLPAAAAAGQVRAQPGRPPRQLAIESLVSGGCIISGAVFRSVLFSSVRVHSHASVNWSVLLPHVESAAACGCTGSSSIAASSCPTAWSSAKTPPRTRGASTAPPTASRW
jgi:glucose-1-phosphate adenylyltransferase